MYKRFLFFFNNYILENIYTIVFVSLTILFTVNALLNIGLLNDETYGLSCLLIDVSWGDVNRDFEAVLTYFATKLLLFFGVTDINLLIKINGFWTYFSTLLLLFISYSLYPKKNKDLFVFTLLSYLIIMNIVSGFVTVQSFMSAGLYWIIITPIIFEDFNTIPYKKLLVMLFASCFMIKGYQLDIVFFILFIILGCTLIKKTQGKRKYLILIFLLLNIFSLFYTTYNYIFPLKNKFFLYSPTLFMEVFNSKYLGLLILFFILLFFLIYLLVRNKKSKIICFLTAALMLVIFGYLVIVNFIYSIAAFRILNHILPLIFSFIIFIIYKKHKIVNMQHLKLLNFILLITFVLNISIIAIKWNKQLNNMYLYLVQNEGFLDCNEIFTNLSEGQHLHHNISILIQKQHGTSNIKSVFLAEGNLQILPNLKKYGIYYSSSLLNEAQKFRNREYV